MTKSRKPISVYLLIFMMIFQSLSGLFGGIVLMIDPTGDILLMPLSFLYNSPFTDYLVPGIILFFVLGVFPSIASIGLILNTDWTSADKINIYKNKHWAWTWSLYTGIMLIIWITVESAMIGGGHFLQTTYDIVGILIIIFALFPSALTYYSMNN